MITDIKQLPQLRFPDFTEKWAEKKLGELLEFKNGINAEKEQYGSGFKFINVLDILQNPYIVYDKIIGSVLVDKEIFDKYLVKYGDVLFQRSSETREEVGSANVYLDRDKPATFGGFVIRGKKIGNYEPVFLNFLLKTDLARNQITSKSGGSTRFNVGQDTLSSVSLLFPPLPEQERIASFLMAIDSKLELLTQKKTLLEQYKKGITQQIFSQHIRFKDDNGNEFSDWQESKIGEIANVGAGATPNTLKREYWKGDIRWMNSGELNLKKVFEVENRITEKGLKHSSTKLLPKYCVLIGLAGQGRTRGTVAMNMIELCTNQSIAAILPNVKYFISEFMYHNLDNRYDEIRSLSTGDGGRGGLNLQIIKSLKIRLPSISEQQKIASFLTSIDSKINKVQQQIEIIKTYKKGLLQQLFI